MKYPRTLILPDLHNRIAIHQSIIDVEKAEQIVHLGDYWDYWYDGPEEAKQTALWVRDRIHAKDIMLLGNHDVWYLYKNDQHLCSGNHWGKENAIDTVIGRTHRNAFRLFYFLRPDLLATHAGLAKRWVHGVTRRDLQATIERILSEAEAAVKSGGTHPLIHCCSKARGGWHDVPGVLWQSWEEFAPVPHLSQIVGHTPSTQPRVCRYRGGVNWCIDTHSDHYAVMEEDGSVEVKSVMERVVGV